MSRKAGTRQIPGPCVSRRKRLFRQVGCGLEVDRVGGTSNLDLVVAGHKPPVISLLVKDGDPCRVELEGNGAALAGRKLNALPSSEALEGFTSSHRKPGVDLGNLGSP